MIREQNKIPRNVVRLHEKGDKLMLFLQKEEVLAMHQRAAERTGGALGILNEGALESALAAPGNRYYYERADLAICAATYLYHLTQAHAFLDGNKRIAAAVAEAFVEYNGARSTTTTIS